MILPSTNTKYCITSIIIDLSSCSPRSNPLALLFNDCLRYLIIFPFCSAYATVNIVKYSLSGLIFFFHDAYYLSIYLTYVVLETCMFFGASSTWVLFFLTDVVDSFDDFSSTVSLSCITLTLKEIGFSPFLQ
ncbi:hypothetical protein K435DRAFT_27591 [Dendrothele bispora CBS 962.96]|uniref:Uncharacterized protein n=1 Tax=Dendrothele bispora (strain CBS 962.96) TaxID=1314807 RepID=A0A4S8KU07_DENBC|nr:hypothetical protein K435DRAFT_27591 [Dendrothele bispora CBS 962.96]